MPDRLNPDPKPGRPQTRTGKAKSSALPRTNHDQNQPGQPIHLRARVLVPSGPNPKWDGQTRMGKPRRFTELRRTIRDRTIRDRQATETRPASKKIPVQRTRTTNLDRQAKGARARPREAVRIWNGTDNPHSDRESETSEAELHRSDKVTRGPRAPASNRCPTPSTVCARSNDFLTAKHAAIRGIPKSPLRFAA